MKKLLMMVLVGIMSVSMLAGCGKSDEEKAVDEIGQHIQDEAAADGVDLEAELQKDYENLQNSKDEKAKQQATKEAIEAEYDDKIKQAKETFATSTDPKEIREAGLEYITLTKEAQELMHEINDIYAFSILPKSIIEFRANYFENKDKYSNYEYVSIHYDKENSDNNGIVIYFNSAGDYSASYYSEFTIIKSDGKTVSANLSDFITDDASIGSVGKVCLEKEYVTNNKIILAGNSSDWMTTYFYVFDFSGNTLKLENTFTSGEWTHEYEDEALVGYSIENSDTGMDELFGEFKITSIFGIDN